MLIKCSNKVITHNTCLYFIESQHFLYVPEYTPVLSPSHQWENMLVCPPGEHPSEVAEAEAPSQKAAPVWVTVVVVVDNTWETQRNVPKERCVLHHMGVGYGAR